MHIISFIKSIPLYPFHFSHAFLAVISLNFMFPFLFIYLLFYIYINPHHLPSSPAHSFSSVSLQIKAGLSWISARRSISSCIETRYFFCKDWMRQSGKKNGSPKQGTESETIPALTVWSLTQRPNCSVVTYMQRI